MTIISTTVDKNRRGQWHPTPVLLPGESQGWGSLVGCCLWGLTESDMTEVTQQQQQQWIRISQKKWSSPRSQQKSLKCSTWMQPQKWQNDLSLFPRQPFSIKIIQVYAPTKNGEEAEVERFYEELQDLIEIIYKKTCPFHHRGLECKSRKSRDTLSNQQIWPWSTK